MGWANIRHAWVLRQSTWMRRRIAPGAHTLGKRSVFILPTRQGVYLAFFLIAMLLVCINYNLSLGYMLTFFVFSVAMGAMHRTHQNILGMRIEVLPAAPVFAGDAIALPLRITNPTRLNKFAILFKQRYPAKDGNAISGVQTRLDAQDSQSIELMLPPLPRGKHELPALEVSSTYPLGLWRAWSYVFPVGDITVYPEPKSPLPHLLAMPEHSQSAAIKLIVHCDVQGDAVSHVEGADAVAARHIHWPALAKGQLAQRLLDNDAPTEGVLLSLTGCTVAGIEGQLSQLCFAIRHCEAANVPFVLQLHAQLQTQTQTYPTSGVASVDKAHTERCLQALAAYEA
jgi:hypothetical protein